MNPTCLLAGAATCAVVFLFSAPAAGADVASKVHAETLKVHPKVFSMVNCSIADEEAPVVTEFNLDALEGNGNQFYADEIKQDGVWTHSPNEDGTGFFRYRVVEAKDNRFKVEFLSNGGGTLTTKSIIECEIAKREIKRDGKAKTIRVLRVLGYSVKVPKEE
jgi:hypothetical protein